MVLWPSMVRMGLKDEKVQKVPSLLRVRMGRRESLVRKVPLLRMVHRGCLDS